MSRPIVARPLTFLAPAPIVAQSGVLRLTNFVPNGINQFGARGSLIIALSQPALPPTYFRATFKLLIGGGNGADGFSFSYGDLPAGAIGELGSGRGLRVCWRTHNTNAIEVWYGESLLHASSPPGGASLRGDEFVEASIEYLPTGLSVSHAGHAYVAALPIGEWEPRRGWRFGCFEGGGKGGIGGLLGLSCSLERGLSLGLRGRCVLIGGELSQRFRGASE